MYAREKLQACLSLAFASRSWLCRKGPCALSHHRTKSPSRAPTSIPPTHSSLFSFPNSLSCVTCLPSSNSGFPQFLCFLCLHSFSYFLCYPVLLIRMDWLPGKMTPKLATDMGAPRIHGAVWRVSKRPAWHRLSPTGLSRGLRTPNLPHGFELGETHWPDGTQGCMAEKEQRFGFRNSGFEP